MTHQFHADELPTKADIGFSQKPEKTAQKNKTDAKIQKCDALLELIQIQPMITTTKLAETLGISRRSVSTWIRLLKSQGRLRRIGAKKGGRWEVIE